MSTDPSSVRRAFGQVVAALMLATAAMGGFVGWAYLASDAAREPLDYGCFRYAPNESARVQAQWMWFPPGVRCRIHYGEVAGWRVIEPSWTDVVVPGVLLLVTVASLVTALGVLAWRMRATGSLPRRAGVLVLLVLAAVGAIGVIPCGFDSAGLLALLWLPVVWLGAGVLVWLAWRVSAITDSGR